MSTKSIINKTQLIQVTETITQPPKQVIETNKVNTKHLTRAEPTIKQQKNKSKQQNYQQPKITISKQQVKPLDIQPNRKFN